MTLPADVENKARECLKALTNLVSNQRAVAKAIKEKEIAQTHLDAATRALTEADGLVRASSPASTHIKLGDVILSISPGGCVSILQVME